MLDFFRLTKREYFADFFITPPITAALLYMSISDGFDAWWVAQFIGGLFVWTLYEYAVHRWLSHGFAWLLRDVHKLHHHRQRDYIAIHPLATLAIYILFWQAFGAQSSAAMLGFSIGYVVYAAVHTAFHYATIESGHPLFRLKRHHAIHHKLEKFNFGVTTTLWDRTLGTHRK